MGNGSESSEYGCHASVSNGCKYAIHLSPQINKMARKDFLTKTQCHVSILSDTTSLFQSRRVLSRCERDDDQPIPHTISTTDGLSGLPSY